MSNNKLPSVSGYELVKMLGQGAFGKVFLAVDRNSKEEVALKYFETTALQSRDLAEIVCGVQYLHENSVVHLDLKPANIMVDSDLNVRIADFGSSEQVSWGEPLFAARFTRAYAAPEVHSGNGYDGKLADIWSLGVMIYHLVTEDLPFKNARELESMTCFMPKHVSPGCSALIPGILREQDKRYTLYKIRTDGCLDSEQPD